MYITVRNGTNAGWRRIYEHAPWLCVCPLTPKTRTGPKLNRGSLYACPDCGTRRPSK